jgi:hypothetical protein
MYTLDILNPQKGYMPVQIEPTAEHKLQSHQRDASMKDVSDHARVMGNTALLLQELGDNRTIDLSPQENLQAIEMFKRLGKKPSTKVEEQQAKETVKVPAVALALGRYLSEYEKQVIQDKVQVRTVVMNRLMEISQDEDSKTALKALELLGKASDLFTERSEITITHQSSDELKAALREKIKILMELNTIDATPKSTKLTNQLNNDFIDVESHDDDS